MASALEQTTSVRHRNDYRREHIGTGDWEAWGPEMGPLGPALEDWRAQLSGIEKPWLCWCVHERFCRIQQRLVMEFGWTPVVGRDPRVGEPYVLPGGVRFHCNQVLGLPTMWMWFPLEFVHRLCAKMAFWHSDFLASRRDMEGLVSVFEALDDGETAAYAPRRRWLRRSNPCPGLAACATRGGSLDQWERGCGWWRWFAKHPNFRGHFELRGDNWDHGYGIRYWRDHYGGVVRPVVPSDRGHLKVPWGRWKGRMSKSESIEQFHDVDAALTALGIADLDRS